MDRLRFRDVLVLGVFVVFVGGVFLLNLFVPAPGFLAGERRVPARLPEFGVESVLSGSFMGKFDDYAADSFVGRDGFRRINAFLRLDVFFMSDKSGLYRSGDVGTGRFQRTETESYRRAAEGIQRAADSFTGADMNFYYSIIPDKSLFAERYFPGFDIGAAEEALSELLDGFAYIRLVDRLGAGSFYRTDLHWDQSKIGGVASHILSSMGGADRSFDGFPVVSAGEFMGVFAGQLALPVSGDIMSYLDVPGIKAVYLNEKTQEFEPGPVYDTGRFSGVDPYDLFLRGPQPLVVIENESAPDRDLYIFRDSFGSSLAPLLATAYRRVTVIDLRYMPMMMLKQYFEVEPGADVLFIFSSQIFNNPDVLQT